MDKDEPILEASGINFAYEQGQLVLEDIDITLETSQTMAIAGTSGVGKTTLLEILGTMRQPNAGVVTVGGRNVYESSLTGRATIRGSHLGFVFQESLLLPDLTVWENCRMAVEVSPVSEPYDTLRERYSELMKSLELDPDVGSRQPGKLSTGERQRVAVVRSLMNQPDLLLADEPTGNLDETTSQRLIDLLLPLARKRQVGILVATHDRHLAQSMQTQHELSGGQLTLKHE